MISRNIKAIASLIPMDYVILQQGRHTANGNVVKKTLKLLSPKINNKPTSVAKINLEPSFYHNGHKHFILICVPNLLKSECNEIIRKNNYFHYPKLIHSTGLTLESGICSGKWMRDFFHKSKEKIISIYLVSKNTACVSNLNKCKFPLC